MRSAVVATALCLATGLAWVQPAAAETPAAATPANVAGSWSGVLVRKLDETTTRYQTRWSLRQNGQALSGTATFTEIGGSDYGEFKVAGNVDGDSVYVRVVAEISPSRGRCLPAVSLRYARDKHGESLAGYLRANSVAGGCTPEASGNLKLTRPGG